MFLLLAAFIQLATSMSMSEASGYRAHWLQEASLSPGVKANWKAYQFPEATFWRLRFLCQALSQAKTFELKGFLHHKHPVWASSFRDMGLQPLSDCLSPSARSRRELDKMLEENQSIAHKPGAACQANFLQLIITSHSTDS